MNKSQKAYGLHIQCLTTFMDALSGESDRGKVIVVACWIDEFIKVKLMNEFSKGNPRAREALFSNNGPFATFSAKVNAAFCAGWIDQDVYHDIQVIRKLRNSFAHSVEPASLDDDEVRSAIESLRVPHRQFSDWGDLHAAGLQSGGVVIYSGEKPDEATDQIPIPGTLTFRLALPIVVTVLVSNLSIPFATDETGTAVRIELPKYMESGQQEL